jgi:hypothetical protein
MPPRHQRQAAPYGDYNYHDNSSNNDQGVGTYILKGEVGDAEVRKPSWKNTETVFRPFPCVSFENPETEFEPFMRREYPDMFSDWIRRYCCVWGVGSPATTFLIPAPRGGRVDPWGTPMGILYSAVENACKKGNPPDTSWQMLREGARDRGKQLKMPSNLYLLQGALMRHNSKDFRPPLGWGTGAKTVVLMLSTDCGSKLETAITQTRPGYSGPLDNYEDRFVEGDIVSPLSGRYLTFCQAGSGSNQYQSQPSGNASPFDDVGNDDGQSGGGNRGRSREPMGYDVTVSREFKGLHARMASPSQMDTIRSKWHHWNDLLWLPTPEEQAHKLNNCFPASAILYAFDPVDRSWVLPETRERAVNRVAVGFGGVGHYQPDPGFGPGYAAGAQHAGQRFGGQPAPIVPSTAPPAQPSTFDGPTPWDDVSEDATGGIQVDTVLDGVATGGVVSPPTIPVSPPVEAPSQAPAAVATSATEVTKSLASSALAKLSQTRRQQQQQQAKP